MTFSRKFSKIFSLFLIVFIAYNAVIWFCFTRDLQKSDRPGRGDLARLGYISGIQSFTERPPVLPRQHLEFREYHGQPVDMITIGDSFTNGGGIGHNRYYQDYIASVSNLTVLNVEPYQDMDFVTQTVLYVNNGFLDRIRPRYLLLSSSVKYCAERFAASVDFDRTLSMAELARHKQYHFRINLEEEGGDVPDNVFRFINDGNFKYLLYTIYYRFSDHAFFSKTYRTTLDRPFFSGNMETTLLFLRDDVKNIAFTDRAAAATINRNLNTLADRLAAKGIQLVFMPVVDKYDLYSDHIVANRYPRNRFFDELRPLPRRYRLIDTKAILGDRVRKGERDLFYVDDTHWTWKSSKIIFETERFP
jgi:hypothetical protein